MTFEKLFVTRGYDFRAAGRATRALLSNPDDLPQVFTIIEALSGRTMERLADRLSRTGFGKTLLENKPDIVGSLCRREALEALPEGSLGRAYLAFLDREGISAEGILDASVSGEPHPADLCGGEVRARAHARHARPLAHGHRLSRGPRR